MVKTGVLGISCKEDADDEEIKIAIEEFYQNNKNLISESWYFQFMNEAGLDEIHTKIESQITNKKSSEKIQYNKEGKMRNPNGAMNKLINKVIRREQRKK